MGKVREKKQKGWFVATIALIALSVCLIAALAFTMHHNRKARQEVEQGYRQSLIDLGDNLNNVEVDLSKLMIAPSGKYASSLLTDIYSHSLAAERALSRLPLDARSAENASDFLNSMADFAFCYQQAIAAGKDCKPYCDNIENMYVAARQLNSEVEKSVSMVASRDITLTHLSDNKPFVFRGDESIRHNSIDYPELIYDGPFSDGRKEDEYKCLCGLNEITAEEALNVALNVLPDFKATKALQVGECSCGELMYEIEVYNDSSVAFVTVSSHGGKVVNLSVIKEVSSVMLGENTAKACAKQFALSLGYEVEPVWYLQAGGVAYVNLAPIYNDTVLYTDLVKVKIALDNGEPLGLEAKNYCLNHTQRDLTLTMNASAVPALIDSRLTVKGVRGALIPLENGSERLCYEVSAEYKGLDYFIYLDSDTGETVKIMRVVDGEQGSMVM